MNCNDSFAKHYPPTLTPWDVLWLAVLLSGKDASGQLSGRPTASSASVFWHNMVLSSALMWTCVHMCRPRIDDKQSKLEAAETETLGVIVHPLVQHRAVFSKEYGLRGHDSIASALAAVF